LTDHVSRSQQYNRSTGGTNNAGMMRSLAQLRNNNKNSLSSSCFSSSSNNWFDLIQPTNNISSKRKGIEFQWQQTLSSSAGKSSLLPSQWTIYDEKKVETILNLLFNIMGILRLVTVPDQRVISSSGSYSDSSSVSAPLLNMKKIFHFPLLCHVFIEAIISIKQFQLLHESIQDGGEGMITINYQNKLIMIAENTIMILYSLILSKQVTISLDSASASSQDEIAVKSVLQIAEMLPNSSFCRIVIRWIYEELTR
jgi:hypothetical protein